MRSLESDIFKSRKFLLVNRFTGITNNRFKIVLQFLFLLQKGLLVSIFFPVAYTLIPATINQLQIEWAYGLFLGGSIIGYIFLRFVIYSKSNLVRDLSSNIDIANERLRQYNDKFSKFEKSFTKKCYEEARNKIPEIASKLPSGYWRRHSRLSWIEPITGFLIILFFFNNPQVKLLSKEYLDVLANIAFVSFDLIMSGFFGSFDQLTNWVPELNKNGSQTNSIIIGLLKFSLVAFLTIFLVDEFKYIFSKTIWFQGNHYGLLKFIKNKFGDSIDIEGAILIYDFGISSDFGTNKSQLTSCLELKKTSEEITDFLLSIGGKTISQEPEKYTDEEFYEKHNLDIILDHTNIFSDGNIGVDIAADDDFPSILYSAILNLSNIDRIEYEAFTQKLYFISKDDTYTDAGITILFPFSIIFEISDQICLALINSGNIISSRTFPLSVNGEKVIKPKNRKLLKKIIMGLRRKRNH